MRAETSLRFSQLSLQCLNASQNPTARRAWSPAENLHLLSKCKPITAGCRGAIVPSSFLLPLTKQKKKRGLKKTKQKHVFVFLSRNTEGRYSSAADDINKTVVLLTATILGFGNTERPQSSHCLTPRYRKLNKFLKIVILQISRRATANYPQSNSSPTPTSYTVTNIGIVFAGRNALCRVALRLAGLQLWPTYRAFQLVQL